MPTNEERFFAAATPAQRLIAEREAGTQHLIPKCLSCETVTHWVPEPMLLPRHWITFAILLLAFGSGIVYLIVVLIIRNNPDNRDKLCPYCGARNVWTFIYDDANS